VNKNPEIGTSKIARLTAIGILIVGLAAWSCGRQKPAETQQDEKSSLRTTAAAKSPAKAMVTVKGSDTMVHLVSTWAEAYMKANPDTELSVTGGGSGTGIAALLNGTTDICAASREINEKEKKQAEKNKIQPTEVFVARDGIAVIVNAQNPVNTLTMEQIKKLYVGAYTKWSQVGGPDERVILLSRESSSGTYMFFQEHVLEKADYAQSVRLMPATSAIIQEVSANKSAIGYAGLGYAAEAKGKVKMLEVKARDDAPATAPSEETVKAGTYPISRKLYFYVNGTPTGAVKAFLDFCLSDAGQKIVRETGYVTVK